MACIAKRRGRYVIDFYDNHGKRRWKTLPKGTTKKKAREAMRDIEDQVRKGIYLPDRKIPIFEEVVKDWLEQKKYNVRVNTWKMYERLCRLHLSEKFNGVKVNRITTALVEKYITDRQQQGINLETLRKTIVTLNMIMTYTVRHKYIDYNPVRDAERPRDPGDVEEDEIRILTPPEISALIDAVDNHKYRILFMLAIMSGARQGELLGLKWTDVVWFNKQIHIQRTYQRGRWYKPKTKTSNREIDLGPVMMSELKRWHLACPPNELDLVFPNEAGGPIDQSGLLKRHFYPALKKAGIERIRFYDLRHTFASLLIEQGENIKYVQSQLGHSSPMMTLNVYAHLMESVNQESPRKLENTIFEGTGSRMVADTKKDLSDDAISP